MGAEANNLLRQDHKEIGLDHIAVLVGFDCLSLRVFA